MADACPRVSLGEEIFHKLGYSVIAPSRPGYGRTPLTAGRTPALFADTPAAFLTAQHLNQIVVVGISAGGRTALALAEHHPQLVSHLILVSAVGYEPWPDRSTRIAAMIAFNAWTQRLTWAAMHQLARRRPHAALRILMRDLSDLDSQQVVDNMSPSQQQAMAELVQKLQSGRGFLNDLRPASGDPTKVQAPTLIVHSRHGATVPRHHSTTLADKIPRARTLISPADSHLVWFSPHYNTIEDAIAALPHRTDQSSPRSTITTDAVATLEPVARLAPAIRDQCPLNTAVELLLTDISRPNGPDVDQELTDKWSCLSHG